MAEKPILFSGEMVRAILNGRKTQTRRVITPQFEKKWGSGVRHGDDFYSCHVNIEEPNGEWKWIRCPYGQPGDRLWVKETWRCEERGEYGVDGVHYRADDAFIVIENTREASDAWGDAHRDGDPWRPSIFMPRWASRITLDVVRISVERVRDINEKDAQAEGMVSAEQPFYDARHEFQALWNKINAKRGFGWDVNPWVWVVEFNVVEVKS